MKSDPLVHDVEFNDTVFFWIANDTDRIFPALSDFDLLFQKLPE